ncbi:MAG TPA: nitrate- and nitrite sensing domain-containing protein [Pilimelia sp.]|nr:nitrate- and nitrite sensing domain-containing protein [Pilimelia sp.]
MSTRPTALPESGQRERGAARRWLPRLRDARIRTKLALILVVPLLAVVALAGLRLVDSSIRAVDATLVRSLTSLAVDVSALAHDVHRERMAAAKFLDPADRTSPDAYNAQVNRTDERIAKYRASRDELGSVPAAIQERLNRIDEHLTTLNGTRQEVLGNQQVSVTEAVLRYGVIIGDLVSYGEAIGQTAGEGELADGLRAVAAFAKAKAATAEEEAVAFAALASGGQLDQEEFSSFVATLTSQQEALLAFSLVANPDQRALVNATVTGDAVVLADQASNEVSRTVGPEATITADDAARAIGAVNDLMRWAEIRLEEDLLVAADDERSGVVGQVIVESILLVIVLAVAIALAVLLARSLIRALSRLREGALSVANHDLPQAVARLRDARSLDDGGVEEITEQLRDPIKLTNRDEVGQVGQAFNVVHREAVRIAAEQAALRTSVSAMFLNLARRSQALVDRMIGELDNIERNEEDPKRLAQLFQLDHLATRMRRNDENLLVLAGADSAPPRREDALLVDALRAAQSEVELYNRIEFGTVDTDISIAAPAVNDVVRLIAELLDNATRFSPPNTIVVAEARRIRDYVLIQIEDRGLGLSDAQIEAFNRRLSEPPAVDVAAFRLMGLAVVGRLAARYGVRVELRQNADGGTVAHISLPSDILILPRFRGRDQALSRPRSPLAVEPGGLPSGNNRFEPLSPALTARAGAATLTEPWAGTPSGWDAPPLDTTPLTDHVTAAHATLSAPPFPAYGQEAAVSAAAEPVSPPLATPPATGARTDAAEVPIFREMEASWFRSHGTEPVEPWAMPTAGHPPPPPPAPPAMTTAHPASPVSDPPAGGYGAGWGATAPHATATSSWGGGAAGQGGSANGAAGYGSSGGPAGYGGAPGGGSGYGAAGGGPGYGGAPGGGSGYSAPGGGSGYSAPGGGSGYSAAGGGAAGGDGSGSSLGPAGVGAPVGGQSAYPPPPKAYAPPEVPAATSAVPRQRASENGWQTRADEGWRRANEAAVPSPAGHTRSGLPKRVPQAQLVPGGVEPTGRERTRRTPEEVRGLLAAYHRGVQRGRSAGTSATPGDERPSTKETSG